MKLSSAFATDLAALQQICRDAYSLNFAHHWNEGGLDWWLEEEFGTARLIRDLADDTIHYYFIQWNGQPLGFAKISLTGTRIEKAAQLEKIYILPSSSGRGLGRFALRELFTIVAQNNCRMMALHVIDTNTTAIHFYESLGFVISGKTRIDIPYFKDELRGMYLMQKEISPGKMTDD